MESKIQNTQTNKCKKDCGKKLRQDMDSKDFFILSKIHFTSTEVLRWQAGIKSKSVLISVLFSGAFLLHLSLELFFKGVMVYYNKSYCPTHNLIHLSDNVQDKVRLNQQNQKILKALDGLHDLRYNVKGEEVATDYTNASKEIIDHILRQDSDLLFHYNASIDTDILEYTNLILLQRSSDIKDNSHIHTRKED